MMSQSYVYCVKRVCAMPFSAVFVLLLLLLFIINHGGVDAYHKRATPTRRRHRELATARNDLHVRRASYQPIAKRKRPVLPQRSNVTKRSTTVCSAELDAHYGVLLKTAMFHFYWNNFNILFNNIYDTRRRVCLIHFFIFCPHFAALPSRLSLSPARHPPPPPRAVRLQYYNTWRRAVSSTSVTRDF